MIAIYGRKTFDVIVIKFTYSFVKIEKYIVNRFFKLENIYESAKNVSSIALRKYKNYVIDCFVEI